MWVKVFVPTGEGLKITYCLFHVGKGVCFIDTFGIRGGEFIPCV